MDQSMRENRIHGTDSFPFQIYRAAQQGGGFVPCHWHPEFEIILVEEGQVGISIADQQYTGQTGDVFFVAPGELHEIRSDFGQHFLSSVFPLDFLQFHRQDYVQSEILAPIAGSTLCFPSFLPHDHPVSGEIAERLHDIASQCEQMIPGYQLMIKSLLLQITALCIQHSLLMQHAVEPLDYRTKTLHDIIDYLDAHYQEHLTLTQIAKKFNLTPQYFCSFFKENFGRTPIQHINFLRIERASRLLLESNLSIMEIGFQVGFDNFSYFIKRFREIFHCTPSAYRKNIRIPNR